MAWRVLADEDFAAWLIDQDDRVRIAAGRAIEALVNFGPQLGRPKVDTLKGSKYEHMKELRFQVGGSPYRLLFAFDPQRRAVLLLAGDKGKDKRWYDVNIPIADARYERHLGKLAEEN